MEYYDEKQAKKMRAIPYNRQLDKALDKHLSDRSKWGADVRFNRDGKAKAIEIYKVTESNENEDTWEYYATISLYDSKDGKTLKGTWWQLYTCFKGKKKDELWILGHYSGIGFAARRIALGIEKMKPVKVY